MIYTEKEGEVKRCTPSLVLLLLDKERYEALMLTGGISTWCIGRHCAQWRFYDVANDEGLTYFPVNAPYQGRGHAKNGAYTRAAPARGYCGLAGKME